MGDPIDVLDGMPCIAVIPSALGFTWELLDYSMQFVAAPPAPRGNVWLFYRVIVL